MLIPLPKCITCGKHHNQRTPQCTKCLPKRSDKGKKFINNGR